MVNVVITIIAPEGRVGKTQGDWVLGSCIVPNHMRFDVAWAKYLFALKADPVFRFILAFPTLELWKMFLVNFGEVFDELLNSGWLQVWAIELRLDSKSFFIVWHVFIIFNWKYSHFMENKLSNSDQLIWKNIDDQNLSLTNNFDIWLFCHQMGKRKIKWLSKFLYLWF